MEWLTTLSDIGLPTIIIVLVGLFGAIKGVEACWKWGKEKFLYFYNRKKNSEKLVQDVSKHNNEIQSIHEKIDKLIDAIEKQNKKNDKYDRDTARVIILDMYDKFKQQGYVTMIQIESYKSLYISYTDKGGNGLIKDTVDPYIMSLEVRD
jgi:glucan phosphorylase